MDPIALNLDIMADYLLGQAAESPQGRASQHIDLDHKHLRMTGIGFATGGALPEHSNPGEAVLQVLRGRIRLTDALRSLELEAGVLARVPTGKHLVEALEPSVILLMAISLPGPTPDAATA